jgi:uncharacterized protein
MPLLVNIQQLFHDDLSLKGELPVEDLALDVHDEVVQARSPLQYELSVEKLEDALLVQGRLRLKLDCRCVRCLKPMVVWLDLTGWACHLPLQGEDAVPVVNDSVDLTPHIREDILLGFPQYPVCEPECGGLTPGSRGTAKGTSGGETIPPSVSWSELDKLKL